MLEWVSSADCLCCYQWRKLFDVARGCMRDGVCKEVSLVKFWSVAADGSDHYIMVGSGGSSHICSSSLDVRSSHGEGF